LTSARLSEQLTKRGQSRGTGGADDNPLARRLPNVCSGGGAHARKDLVDRASQGDTNGGHRRGRQGALHETALAQDRFHVAAAGRRLDLDVQDALATSDSW